MSFASVLARLEKLENPYPGLRPFKSSESHLFFGRDLQVMELLERLDHKRLVAVVGVSGSGKSSLVRAGLIPALERGGVPGRRVRWRIVLTRPAGAPFENLAASLGSRVDAHELRQSSHGLVQFADRLAADENLLVVVDQFEELFRYKDEESATQEGRRRRDAAAGDAAEFVQLLLAAHRHSAPVFIVLTMRSDYLGDCAEFRDLPETLNDCQYLVPRLTREQRKQAIEGPLGRVTIAPRLVQRMLNDAGDEPDQLPILQHALMRTWNFWQKAAPEQERPIDLEDYEAVGGFDDALNQHADELLGNPVAQMPAPYAAGDVQPATIAEVIFKRLTAKGRDNRERRDPAQLSELWALCGAETQDDRARVIAVIDLFREGQASFLAPRGGELTPDTYIDITHESLIRQWKKLGEEWVSEELKSARTFLRLVDRSAGEPLAGLDLADALDWERQRNKTAAWAKHYAGESALASVMEFIRRSQARERKRASAQRRNFWIAVAVAVLFAALAVATGYEYWKAQRAGTIALVRQFTAESDLLRSESLDLEPAVLLAAESMQRLPQVDNDRAIREATELLPHQIWRVAQGGGVHAVAFSADGRYVATGSDDNTARVFEAASGKELWSFTQQGTVNAVAFNADGRYVATGSFDHTARVFEAASGKEVSHLVLNELVAAIHFGADRSSLMTASVDQPNVILTRHLLHPQDLIDDACSRVTRNLTPEEWRQNAGTEIPYHKTCPKLP